MAATLRAGHSPDVGLRRGSDGASRSNSKLLNRSLSGDEGARGFFKIPGQDKQHPRDLEYPLKRFSKAKDDMKHIFELLHARLVESQNFVCEIHEKEESFKKNNPVQLLREQADGIIELLKRDHMKVAFFGRTSNGKSTVINSLLGEKVLPTGMGHTTNCFCSVVGVDESEGYLCTPTSEERQNVKNVRQLAHSLSKEHLDPNSMVKIFWPKSKCPLLCGEVELVDSPGIDMDHKMDQWITDYCMDADVFVLVSNAESALNNAEKDFFHRVSEHLSKPNIFILNNRWDASDDEDPDLKDELKKTILRTNVDFLSGELAVVDKKIAKERVFFVSAKEMQSVRTKLQPETVMEEEGRGLSRGWKDRSMEFEMFEKQFKQCVSDTAISTKFEQHYKKGLMIVDTLENVLEEELSQLTSSGEEMEVARAELSRRAGQLRSKGQSLQQTCVQEVEVTVAGLEKEVADSLKKMQKKLPNMIRDYSHSTDNGGQFVPEQVAVYQQHLCEHLDNEIGQDVESLFDRTLARRYEGTREHLISNYQTLLGMPRDNMHHLYQLMTPPTFSLSFKCADICQGLVPDIKFNFLRSLGLSGRWLKDVLNLESVLGNVYSQLSQLLSVMKMEYIIPISLLGVGLMLPRLFNWRVWLISMGVYGSVYTWKWSTHDPKEAFHKQFASHVGLKMREHAAVSSVTYRKQVGDGLKLLLDGLHQEVGKEEKETEKRAKVLVSDIDRCRTLQQTAKSLKNGANLLRSDYHLFRDSHLSDAN